MEGGSLGFSPLKMIRLLAVPDVVLVKWASLLNDVATKGEK
jgi:hypothetical protein